MTTVTKSLLCTTWTNLSVHQLAMSAQATPPPCGSLKNLTDPWALDTIRFHDPPNVRFDGGCYEVAWPWKEFPPSLPDTMYTPKFQPYPFNYFYESNESYRGRGLARQKNDSIKRLNETNEGARLRIFLGSCTVQTNSSILYCIQFSASSPTNTMHLATRTVYIIRRSYWTVQRL